jgi:hypothetical protein
MYINVCSTLFIVNEKYSYSSWYLEQGSLWVLPPSRLTLVCLLSGLKTIVGQSLEPLPPPPIQTWAPPLEVLMMLICNKVAISRKIQYLLESGYYWLCWSFTLGSIGLSTSLQIKHPYPCQDIENIFSLRDSNPPVTELLQSKENNAIGLNLCYE